MKRDAFRLMPAASTPPRTVDELRARLGERGERLTPRQREAALHALEHPNDVALSAVAALAQDSGIAASAFIRMAQALGFTGYGELQRLFIASLQRATPPSYRERIRHFGGDLALENPADPVAVLRAFSQANMVSLEHLRDDAHRMPLAHAIQAIKRARAVYVLGLRRSYAVASYLAYALNRVGRPSVQITGLGGAIAEQASAAGPKDLLIAISFPPYAADTLQVCEQVRAAGARRLAITDSALGPVAIDADIVLQVNDAELLGFRSLTAAMSLAQTLAMGFAFKERGRRVAPELRSSAALDDIDC